LRSGAEAKDVVVFEALDRSLSLLAGRISHDQSKIKVGKGNSLPFLQLELVFRLLEGVFLAQH